MMINRFNSRDVLLVSLLYGVLGAFLSFNLLPYYYSGDQIQYGDFYYQVSSYNLFSGFDLYKSSLGSTEPIYFLMVWFFSNLMDKNVFCAILNGLFLFLTSRLIFGRVTWYILVLLLTNFYMLVLFFAAERLKVSIIFVLLYFNGVGNRYKYIWLAIAVFTHVQVLILIFSYYIYYFWGKFFEIGLKKFLFSLVYLIGSFVLLMGLMYVMREQITSKMVSYAFLGGWDAVIKTLVFIILAVVYAPTALQPLVVGLPVVVASYFLGSDRLVMFAYIIFLSYGLAHRRGANMLVFVSLLYFSWKGYSFFMQVINYGNGFYLG